jgi:hypothetical protein
MEGADILLLQLTYILQAVQQYSCQARFQTHGLLWLSPRLLTKLLLLLLVAACWGCSCWAA